MVLDPVPIRKKRWEMMKKKDIMEEEMNGSQTRRSMNIKKEKWKMNNIKKLIIWIGEE